MVSSDSQFPNEFLWGVGTASAQVEGAAAEGGKGESIWDRFASSGRGTDSPAVACDHYHRYEADFALIRELGIRHYRFSISWPRIYPEGTGILNRKGLAFYDRLVDCLLENGISPWATMFHWDLPQALESQGGWPMRSTAEAFATYAATIVKQFGDRIRNWFTLNEIPSFIGLGYGTGMNAPGRQESPAVLNQAYHHALLAHGFAVEAVRLHGRGGRVGLVHNPSVPIPVMEIDADIDASRAVFLHGSAQLLGPLCAGAYPESFLRSAGKDAPNTQTGDLAIISRATDFLGLNVYTGAFVRGDVNHKPVSLQTPADFPTAGLSWLKIAPRSLYWAVRHLVETYAVRDIYVAENGVCYVDDIDVHGEINDVGRIEYIRSYLCALRRAIADGYPVRGYFLWSLLDNFEWAEGYAKRFGIVHVNYRTQARTKKLSARWYGKVAAAGRMI